MTSWPSVIGIVGTGFIARGLLYALEQRADLKLGPILTRRSLRTCDDFPRPDLLTNSLASLLRSSDVIVECSGHVLHAAEVIDAALKRGIPVITSNVEFHVTLGSSFEGRGYLTEAEGDQPGVLADMRAELIEMGFAPVAYGNLKRFYDPDPSSQSMETWAKRKGISLQQVTSFTDGTKLQMEMALVGNAFGAGLLQQGMRGTGESTIESFGQHLGEAAEGGGRPIIDYAVSPDFPPGVMITAKMADARQAPYLSHLSLGPGPFYTFYRPHHLCHLEMLKTIKKVLKGEPPLLTNGPTPLLSVAAVAKRDLQPGDPIDHAIGSFVARGICVNKADEPSHVPIGLLYEAEVVAPIAAGEIITFDHVRLPDSFGLSLFRASEDRRGDIPRGGNLMRSRNTRPRTFGPAALQA